MKTSILATNGGPHPADKWADVTTDAILDLLVDANPDDTSDTAVAARKSKRQLGVDLYGIFAAHHAGVQVAERKVHAAIKTAEDAALRLTDTIVPNEHRGVMDEVNAALAKTPWADHFAKPEVGAALWQIIGQHTADVMHIERRWHFDRISAGA